MLCRDAWAASFTPLLCRHRFRKTLDRATAPVVLTRISRYG
jgi:hypothetical protein